MAGKREVHFWTRGKPVRGNPSLITFRYWFVDDGTAQAVTVRRHWRYTTAAAFAVDEVARVHGGRVTIIESDEPLRRHLARWRDQPFKAGELGREVRVYLDARARIPTRDDPDDGCHAWRYRIGTSHVEREVRVRKGKGAWQVAADAVRARLMAEPEVVDVMISEARRRPY